PCTFAEGVNAQTLKLDGTDTYSLERLSSPPNPPETLSLVEKRADGKTEKIPVTSRLDTPIEVEYYLHGGILPFVLRQLLQR
ncbi:MAG: hypothetical protein ACKODZ_07595, partial [Verrucomicrobiota bacterium]